MAAVYNSLLDAFDLYHQWNERKRTLSAEYGTPDLPALGHAFAGSIGASVSNIVTYPLAVIITRLQVQRQLRRSSTVQEADEYRSVQDAVLKIYRQEGLKGFCTGLVEDTLKSAADSFLFFLVYNSLRQARLKSRQRKQHLPVLDELSVGFLAGALARFCTMPISTIVTRMQTTLMVASRSTGTKAETISLRSIAKQIQAEKGVKGFWSGYSATLVLTLNPSLTFFFFENLKRITLPHSKRSEPGPAITFFIAALSKVLASSITYPFSLAKARTQASTNSAKSNKNSKGADAEKSRIAQTMFDSAAMSNHKTLDRTVLGTILHIARTEGVASLYEGLEGEILKGFFSHGITMLMKDAVHGLIIRLYFTILRLLNRYPGPDKLAQLAKD
ncbi:MAG: hypothetical protein LQ340_005735 [Diploschistes diacapsis]|nr:MAG: hypothetical protein LQ340_005735 [Diploschistes diacapsis]